MGHQQRLERYVLYIQQNIKPLYLHFFAAPLTVTLFCLLFVNRHSSPVDDCPCFEDDIAFISVILGIITSF